MSGFLSGRTVGFLVAQVGVEEAELVGPRGALDDAGATTLLIAPRPGAVEVSRGGVAVGVHDVDQTLVTCTGAGLDALVLPDGETSSDLLRREPAVARLLQSLVASGRPVGAFGHAVWSLLDAGLLEGRQVTSHPSLRREVERVGGRWHDQRVVVDENLITSRASRDVDAFTLQLVAHLDR